MIVVVNAHPIDIVPTLGVDGNDATCGASPVNVAVALAGLGQPVGLLALDDADLPGNMLASFAVARPGQPDAVPDRGGWRWAAAEAPERFASPTVAVHTGVPDPGAGADVLDRLCLRERARGEVTVSLDLRAHPAVVDDVTEAQAWALRRIRCADIVTANVRDLAYLYPGVAPSAIAHYWRDEGVACSAITSDRDGVLLVAPNGLTYRRTMPAVLSGDMTPAAGPFIAGLLTALAAIGALGSDPRARLADVRPQQWLTVLERADTAARTHATRAHQSRRHVRTVAPPRMNTWRRPAADPITT